MAVQQTEAVEREIRIAAKPETVFEFLVDEEKHVLWMGRRAELDPRPGGVYLVEIDDRITARGEFLEIEPPSRVLLAFGWEGDEAGSEPAVPPGSSRVELTVEPDGDGTVVRLRHHDLPEPARAMHGEGWEVYLGRLAVAAAGGDPGPDPHVSS
ncbi:MAG TPA: SRPBCC domain-containing protein [Gaiellaceae bacterium]|nr:SRPBCC domain-containing protein [Gaiellaceae bacterium]